MVMVRIAAVLILLVTAAGAAAATPSLPTPAVRAVIVPAQAEVIMQGAHAGHLLEMDLKRLLALALGVAIGMQAVEALALPELRFIGVIGGAMLGEWWYRQKFWPFTSADPWWKFW